MAYTPIQRTLPQYVDTNGDPYSGAVLKAYTAGTSTPLSFATDSTGGTTIATVALNANGYPENAGTQIIPHLNENYKLALYPTQAAADSDTGSIWTIDNIILATADFSDNEVTNVGNGTARDSAINVGQVQDSQFISLGTTAGAADTYTLNPSVPITAYTSTQFFIVQIHATNLTTTPYLQISGIADPATNGVIKKLDATRAEIAVEASDMLINGLYMFKRNSTDTNWILWNPELPYIDLTNAVNGAASQATTTTAGKSILPNQITISNGTDADHDIDFTAGNFIFSGGDGQAAASALTKQLDATWAAGTAAGGLASGLTIAIDTTYHCFALSNATGTVTDFGFDTSLTAANLLADAAVISAGLTKYTKIASLLTDGSANILNGTYRFRNDGGYRFTYNLQIQDRAESAAPTSPTSLTLSSPPNTVARLVFHLEENSTSTTAYVLIVDKNYSNTTASSTNYTAFISAPGTDEQSNSGYTEVEVDSSSAITIDSTSTSVDLQILTVGWTE